MEGGSEMGEGVVGNDEGRGSNGGGREGDLTWACHLIIACVHSRSWAVVFIRACSSALMCIRFCSWAVAFVRGGWPSFVGTRVRIRVCSWAVRFVPECSCLFVGGRDVDEVWWWWAIGGWWWWLLLVAVVWWRGRVVGCRKRR